MPDIIHLLPDSVANQIAAGEVVQRPASVVKELMENAVDAGATSINLVVKDSGRTLIQVIDNGSGMSETDARMAFERHATSKITDAADLFAIRTMGFRGEALASIAAVAEVVLRTRKAGNDLGTEIHIAGSQTSYQEPVQCQEGTNFQVKNLYFNTPARRKFLKSNTTELKYIIQEFQRLAIPFPEISFSLIHNNSELYNLPPSNLKQRIVRMFGKNAMQGLVDIHIDTSIVKISGFLGKPEMAKKKFGEQYFFVNNRYIRHMFLHRAITQAYEKILPPDCIPSYFIFLEIDPEKIDINIHPTKTEVKFEDEPAIWQILHASVRESLGKFNLVPSIDFDTEASIEIPVFTRKTEVNYPKIDINPDFNPFSGENNTSPRQFSSFTDTETRRNWEKLFPSPMVAPEKSDSSYQSVMPGIDNKESGHNFFVQLKAKYILTQVKSGLMVIDQKRAHERILYEEFLRAVRYKNSIAQQELFPQTVQLPEDEYRFILAILDQINSLGFDLRDLGNQSLVFYGYPAELEKPDPNAIIQSFMDSFRNEQMGMENEIQESLALGAAKASAIPYGKQLTEVEMRVLTDRLFACENPSYTADGNSTLSILSIDELSKKFM